MSPLSADRVREWVSHFREWYLVAIGTIVIVGGLAVATEFGASTVPEPKGQIAGAPAQSESVAPAEAKSPSKNQTAAPAKSSEKSARAEKSQPAIKDNAAPKNDAGGAKIAQTSVPHAPAAKAPPSAKQGPATHAPASSATAAGDPALGQQAFRKCQACHSLDAGKNLIGPSLADLIGKPAGQVGGYNYSAAMKESKIVWDAASLDAFLTAPQKFVPKNKMAFPGLRTETERANVIAFLGGAASRATPPVAKDAPPATVAQRAEPPAARPVPSAAAKPGGAPAAADSISVSYVPDVRITLRSGIAEGRLVYIGVGGTIDGEVNPILSAAEGQVVQLTLMNGEGAEHDIVFPDQNAASPHIVGRGTSTIMVFRATKAGDFIYYCSIPGHREAGMQGQFLVTPRPPDQVVVEADISQQPTEVPPPIGKREPTTIRVDLHAVELEARLAEGTTYGFWTFNGRVPGPMLRARVGDTLDVHVTNSDDSAFTHSVDFHAATGPGGGAAATQVDPGHTKSFKFKALVPGLYVYHCATPMVAHHITNGMYGLILVEPEGGLSPVDHEFYVMQGEIYTQEAFGQLGRQEFSVEKLLNEQPEYFVFNGSVGALSKLHPLKAKVGETVRIYFGVGGPNFTSSFHVIGEIFDRVYSFADLQSPPLRGVQTITVPPGGATIVEFKVDVPGNYILVDHALSRAERGLVGILQVEGPANPEIFDGKVETGSGH